MYEVLLIVHFLALAAGIGMSLTMAMQAALARRLPPEEAGRFMALASGVTIIAPVAAFFLIASGLGLVWLLEGAPLDDGPGFWLKMVLVALLVICIAGAKVHGDRARADPAGSAPARAEAFGKGALVLSVLIVAVAVLVFN